MTQINSPIVLNCPKCGEKNTVKKIATGGFTQLCENCGNAEYYNKLETNTLEISNQDRHESSDIKVCPYCAEEVKAAAIKCKHCGEWLNKEDELQKVTTIAKDDNYNVEAAAHSVSVAQSQTLSPTDESKKFLGGIHHPWRRWFARTVDISTIGIFTLLTISFGVGILFPSKIVAYSEALENPIIASIALVVLCIPLEAIFLYTVGATPGKMLFGISVKDINGSTLSFQQALHRSFDVVLQGMGLGIPIIALFTQIFAYKRLTKTGTTLWDTTINSVVTHKTWGVGRTILCVLVVFFIFTLFSVLNTITMK